MVASTAVAGVGVLVAETSAEAGGGGASAAVGSSDFSVVAGGAGVGSTTGASGDSEEAVGSGFVAVGVVMVALLIVDCCYLFWVAAFSLLLVCSQ